VCRARSGSGRRGWQRDAREHELAFSVSYPVLIYGDTERSPELRHEIPLAIGDPFLYLEADGQRAAVLSSLETDRVAALELDLELVSPESLGSDEILAAGGGFRELEEELCLRACGRFGVGRARVPAGFPLALADRLRVAGVAVECDPALFEDRRRVKAGTELEGIRRAQRAAEAGMAAASALLRAAEADDGGLVLDGAPLTCEQVRASVQAACRAHGAQASDDLIVRPGIRGGLGHDAGSGPLPAGEPITIDLWPRDGASACFADMTRTFVIGEPPPEVVGYHAIALESLRRAREAVRPGVLGRDLHALACEPFEAARIPTQRTKAPGERLAEGFYGGLGHGVGLEVHEAPALGRAGRYPLVAGDVVALEPGALHPRFGEVRVEDLVLVTEDGGETLTDYPHGLVP